MNIPDLIALARDDLYRRAAVTRLSIDYALNNRIDTDRVAGFCGVVAVLPIRQLPNDAFDLDLGDGSDAVDAAVIEAFDRDGETTIDLVAWPLSAPATVLTMFRRVPLLGLWTALSPYTYYLGRPLDLHRTPLEWLQADCQGAAIVLPDPGIRMLLDAPGRIAARDKAHAVAIMDAQNAIDRRRLVVPKAVHG